MGLTKSKNKKRGNKSPRGSPPPEKKPNTVQEVPDVDTNANPNELPATATHQEPVNDLKREHDDDSPNNIARKSSKMDLEPQPPVDAGGSEPGDQSQAEDGSTYSDQNKMLAELRRERLRRAGVPDQYEGYQGGYQASNDPWDSR